MGTPSSIGIGLYEDISGKHPWFDTFLMLATRGAILKHALLPSASDPLYSKLIKPGLYMGAL